jgi:hypothetical protein
MLWKDQKENGKRKREKKERKKKKYKKARGNLSAQQRNQPAAQQSEPNQYSLFSLPSTDMQALAVRPGHHP